MAEFTDNLLGAASLAIIDQIEDSALEVLGMGGQAAGALVLLGFRPKMTVTRLAERLRLSQPGGARLVERLVAAGWVQRKQGDDRRVVRLELTDAGIRKLTQLRKARRRRLSELTSCLSSSDEKALRRILTTLIGRLTRDVTSGYANCRLCDTATCQAEGCPVDALAAQAPDSKQPR